MNKQWEVKLASDHPEYAEILERAAEIVASQAIQNSFTVEKLLEIENVEELMGQVSKLRQETLIVMGQSEKLDTVSSEALGIHLPNIHQNFKNVIGLSRKLDELNHSLKNYSSMFRGSISQLLDRLERCLQEDERPHDT